jgi:hypothetical protein
MTPTLSFEAVNRLFHVSLKSKLNFFIGTFCLGDAGTIRTRRAGSNQNLKMLAGKVRSPNLGHQKWNGRSVALPVGRINESEFRKFEG